MIAIVDGKRFVERVNGVFHLRRIKRITLVGDAGGLREHDEAVRKPRGNIKHAVVLKRQPNGSVLPERGGACAQIKREVKNLALKNPYDLGLGKGRPLKVQSAQHALG